MAVIALLLVIAALGGTQIAPDQRATVAARLALPGNGKPLFSVWTDRELAQSTTMCKCVHHGTAPAAECITAAVCSVLGGSCEPF